MTFLRTGMILVLTSCMLAACGADGEPETPTYSTDTRVSTSVGVGVGSSGVHAAGGVGLHRGNVSIFLGF